MAKLIEYLFYVFLFLIPLQTRWIVKQGIMNGGAWEYGTFSIYGTEILLWIILILFFIYLIKNNKLPVISYQLNVKTAIFFSIVGLMLLSVISIFWARDRHMAFLSAFRLVEAIALWVFIVRFPIDMKKLFWVIAGSGAIQSLLALFQFCTQKVFSSKWLGMSAQSPHMLLGESVIENSWGRFLRAYGTFPHPNILGGFLVLAILASIAIFFASKNKKENVASALFIVLNIAGLTITFSRSAYLAFIVSSVIYLVSDYIYSHKTVKKESLVPLAFIFFVLLFSLAQQVIMNSRNNIETRLEQKSLITRSVLLKEGLALFSAHPFLGVGAGNYTVSVFNEINSMKSSWDYQPVHIVYLLVATELGILALIFLLLIIFFSLFFTFKKKNFLGTSLLLSICVIGFFDHYLWSLFPGILLFWLILGIANRYEKSVLTGY